MVRRGAGLPPAIHQTSFELPSELRRVLIQDMAAFAWWLRARAFLLSVLKTARYYLSGLYSRLADHHVFLLSSGMAFSLLVCMMPLLLILFAVLGAVLTRPAITGEIDLFIERVVPYGDAATFVKSFIATRVDEFTTFRNVAGVVGSFGLIFAATGLFSSMRTILSVVFHPEKDESVLRGKLRDMMFVVLVLIYFLVVIAVGPAFDYLRDHTGGLSMLAYLHLGTLQSIVWELVSFLLILLGFYVIYFAVPHKHPPKRTLLVSAFWAALLWHLVAQGFNFYLSHFVTLKRVYGTYALMIAVAFWSYYTSIVFIAGAEIGQLHHERRESLPPQSLRHKGPSRFFRD